jgi:hypothetical protein
MNGTPDKKLLAEKILEVNDPGMIRVIAALLQSGMQHQTGIISVEQYNKEISEAIEQIREGRGIDHQEVKRILSRR